MAEHDNQDMDGIELRRRAEDWLGENAGAVNHPGTGNDTLRLLHELQVHRIELDMQNAELRQARFELESALEMFTDLYDFAPVSYFTLNRYGYIRAANLTGSALMGVERFRLLGRRFEEFVSTESRSLFSTFLGNVFASQTKEVCEVVLLKKENSVLFVQIEGVTAASGEECRIVLIDVSGRKRAEQALREETIERMQAVEALREKEQLLILQSRQAAMGEMIGNIAHQWRQPLNSLGLTIQGLQLYYDLGEFNREILEKGVSSSMVLIQHMSRTIDDFRNFFRTDKKKAEFKVRTAIASTLLLVEDSFKHQRISIEVVAKADPVIFGYRNEYAQVLLNILNNARDVLIERKISDPRVTICVCSEGERAVVNIADNAGGIPEENMEKIFDPYFTTKGPQVGTGVGLFMSKTIIEKNMGGLLSVRNTADGAEFRIEV